MGNMGMGMHGRPGSAYDTPNSRAGSVYGGSQAGYHNPYQQKQAMAMAQAQAQQQGQMPMGMSPNMHVGMGMNLNMSPFGSNTNLPNMGMMGHPMGMGGMGMGMMGGSQGDRGSMYQYQVGGGAGSQMGGSAYGGNSGNGHGHGYQQPAGSRLNSFYANPTTGQGHGADTSPAPSSPAGQHRGMGGNGSGYAPLSGGGEAAPTASSRPASGFLPPTEQDWAPLDLGEAGISDAQLETSIRRICAGADLDTLTKKGVRKELEKEHGVGFDNRKETITRIIEKVLNGA